MKAAAPVVFVIQRFGERVAGGAEAHCRRLALRLASDGLPVEVWTTTALDYRTWAEHYPAGTEADGGVVVRRFPVAGRRAADFDLQTASLLAAEAPSEAQQLDWLDAQGPRSPALLEYLRAHAGAARALVFYTYLYWPTWHGLLAVPEHAVLVPTLHDEPVAHLPIFRRLLAAPRALLFLTPEEQAFARRALPVAGIPARVLGTAVEPRAAGGAPEAAGAGRSLLYLGRVDAGKGAAELARLFIRFADAQGVRFPDVELIFCGEPIMEPIEHPRIRYAGFQPPEAVAALLESASVLAASSPFESLSLVALEAMAAGTPILANARSEVLVGHCVRSGAGLYYGGPEEFEEALSLLLADDALRRRMGEAGRRYVLRHYSWGSVLQALHWALETAGS
jgi:glycosyltransferase involved in cell wall biosynthesis